MWEEIFHGGISREGSEFLMEGEPGLPALFEKRSKTN